MRRPALLVVTTVHQPDDARIRAKLIPSLNTEWDVTYAARTPGPTDKSGLSWWPLRGGRLSRWLAAARLVPSPRWDLVALHDPELLPIGWLRAALGRPTLFDLHENLPAQLRHKPWIPSLGRPLLAGAAGLCLRLTERLMAVTLAEEGYGELFRKSHPVIPNHLAGWRLPRVRPSDGFLTYVGDITEQRGAYLALAAAEGAGRPLRLIGRVAPNELSKELRTAAAARHIELDLTGPLPHDRAMEEVARAEAGLSPLLDVANYRHSLPTKVLEYLAVGIPALAADLPGTRQVIEDLEGTVLVPPGDEEAWRQAGRDLEGDPGRRERAAGQAEEVRERFSWPEDTVLMAYREARR